MLYSCTNMATVGVKGLITDFCVTRDYSELTTHNLTPAKRDVNSVKNDRLVTLVTLITAMN